MQIIAQENWQIQVSEDETFSITVPHKLTKYSNKTLTEVGELNLIAYRSEEPDAYGNVYSINFIDYPDGAIFGDDSLAMDLINSSIDGLPGELIYEEKQREQGHDSVICRKKLVDQNLYSKTKVFVVKDRLYIMLVYSNEDKAFNNGVDKFLDSFKIINV